MRWRLPTRDWCPAPAAGRTVGRDGYPLPQQPVVNLDGSAALLLALPVAREVVRVDLYGLRYPAVPEIPEVDVVLFTSPSTVESAQANGLVPRILERGVVVGGIGPVTARRASSGVRSMVWSAALIRPRQVGDAPLALVGEPDLHAADGASRGKPTATERPCLPRRGCLRQAEGSDRNRIGHVGLRGGRHGM